MVGNSVIKLSVPTMYKKNKTLQNRSRYKKACKIASSIIDAVRNKFWKKNLNEAGGDQKQLYSLVTKLLGTKATSSVFPDRADESEAANDLKNFFVDKVTKICDEIKSKQENLSYSSPSAPHCPSSIAALNSLMKTCSK